MLRGEVTNCFTDVSIRAITEEGDVYAGGMFSVTNRINVLNCYALGDVYGTANTNNKVHIGGFTGMAGAFQYNCYAMGNVTSNRPTVDIGIMDGRIANIAYDRNCYFNKDAKIIENGNEIQTVYTGADGTGSSKDVTFGKTKDEIGSAGFAALLNENVKNVTIELEIADSELGGIMSIYYNRGATGLKNWGIKEGIAVFSGAEAKVNENKKNETGNSSTENKNAGTSSSSSTSSASGSSSASNTTSKIAELGDNTPVVINDVQVPLAGRNTKSLVEFEGEESVDEVAAEETEEEEVEDDKPETKVAEEDSTTEISPEETPTSAKTESNAGMIVLIIILMIAISGFGGVILIRKNK
jgi:hypothetical protein